MFPRASVIECLHSLSHLEWHSASHVLEVKHTIGERVISHCPSMGKTLHVYVHVSLYAHVSVFVCMRERERGPAVSLLPE